MTLESFWTTLGDPNAFDPHIVYDSAGNRWVFVAAANAGQASSKTLVAVSQTSDPTGDWTLGSIAADASGQNWVDYPGLGINKNWIVVTVNIFSGNSFKNATIYACDKAQMYAGGPLSCSTWTNTSGSFQPAVTYDPALSTMYLVQNWNGNFHGSGYHRLSAITGAVGSEVLTFATFFPSVTSTWSAIGSVNFAPQLGSASKIHNGDTRMLKALYRNGSLWCSQTVFLPTAAPTRASVQWWQINPATGTVQQFGRVDDSTGANFFAYPTIAVNKNDDVLIGYSSFSATKYAEADFSFRYGTDTPNTLQPMTLMKAGEAPYYKTYGGTLNRWGDYSSTVVDPVDDFTLWTIQEYATTPGGGFDRWATWWSKVTPAVADMTITKTHSGNFTQGQTGATYTITATNSGTAATTAAVSVTDTLPAGLTATAIAGAGWTCTQPSGPCTRSDTLAAAASYPEITLTVNVAGNAPASVTNTSAVSGGGEINTDNDTADDPTTINASNNAPTLGTVTPPAPSSPPGIAQSFSAVYSDADGYASLNSVYFLVNSSLSGANGTYVRYIRSTNTLLLVNDAGTAFSGSCTAGAAGTLANSQGTLNCSSSTAMGTGNNLTLTLDITPTATFASATAKKIYTYAIDNGSLTAGWTQKGSWTIQNTAPVLGTVTPPAPTSPPNIAQSFSAVYSDAEGYANLNTVYFLVNSSLSGANGIYVRYVRSTNTLSLVNDAGAAFAGSCTAGAAGTLANSQGTVNCASSTAMGTGTDMTLTLNIAPTAAFASTTAKNVYMYAIDSGGSTAGWTQKGSWTIQNTAPTLGTVTPSALTSPAGVAQTFSAVYSDADGYANLNTVYFLVNSSLSGANGIYVRYVRSTNTLSLVNDAGTTFVGSCTAGAAGTLTNSQGTVNCASSAASGLGNDLTLTLNITPKAAFASATAKKVYTYAIDYGALTVGWTQKETWTVTP
jgi:uncharacterized repeat protein (TIGR01451 family)